MTFQDGFRCEVTTTGQPVADRWTKVIAGFLAHSRDTPAHLTAVLAMDGDFALAQACRGLFSLLLARRELERPAREALALARRSAVARGVTRREALYIDALRDWLAGQPSVAAAHFDAVLDAWPEDPLAMKLGQAIRFLLGDQPGMRGAIERVMPAYGADHPALGYLYGCYAFTLEEARAYGEAEEYGRRGLELAPDDAWGLHAVAHVYDMTARPEAGIRFLAARQDGWSHCNNFVYHVWWHLALMHLDLGETGRVLELYDGQVRGERTDDYRDIANATSLLARLELEGVDVGARWEELADLSAQRSGDGCLTFADLHYMLAICGDGRDRAAAGMIARLRTDAQRAGSEGAAVMGDPGVRVARGLKAFRDGAYGHAFAHLAAARPKMQSIGGSHAQRDVFERITIEAAIRSGALTGAQSLIQARSARRGAGDGYARRRWLRIEAALRARLRAEAGKRIASGGGALA